jgi:hypothetical protein
MPNTPPSIYTKPADISPDTLANLGPLRALAGVWQGTVGADVHPNRSGAKDQVYVEDYEAQPIDPQTNGPQLFYGLRYHTHITKPDKTATFHDQVGYWLWEPATNTVMLTAAIPRGEVFLAGGQCDADATTFTVKASVGAHDYGISSNPFLTAHFKTTAFSMTVTANPDGTWTYTEDTTMTISDRPEPFQHTDGNTLHLITPPTPNPLAQVAPAKPATAS